MKENWFSKYSQWLYQSFECPNSQDEHDRRILNFTGVYPEERAYKWRLWTGLWQKCNDW